MTIQEQFNRVIEYSQGIDEPRTNMLFEIWEEKKKVFIEGMGGELIYEYPLPISIEMSEESKIARVDAFIEELRHQDFDWIADFLDAQIDTFYDNKVCEDYYIDDEVIPAGMKLSKAIGRYFRDRYDYDDIDKIQTKMSRLIQENKLSGKLCLSVHPLDFLSSSENQHNWRSCHALDGEYRAGNLSYMLDDCTIMAYIKSEEDVILPRFPEDVPWNNKKWRCLFFFDKRRGIIYAGRQYPFFSKRALDMVQDLLFVHCNYFLGKRKLFSAFGSRWQHNVIRGDVQQGENIFSIKEPTIFMNEVIRNLNEWVNDAEDSLHYNDLLYSSVYTPWTLRYKYKSIYEMLKAPPLTIGGSIPCVCCEENPVFDSQIMLCSKCAVDDPAIATEWITCCPICGERIVKDTQYQDEAGEYYCHSCWEEHITRCVKCGAYINSENVFYTDDGYYDALCEYCYQEQRRENHH